MTERLYYHDAFLPEFDARVLSVNQEGDRWRVTLDRTAFYPTSGGQPHDTGTLGDVNVVEVLDSDNHEVIHFTDRAVAPGPIHGKIDWGRRFYHIQQHTGQHLLSAAFLELFQFPTVSFHLGRDTSTIDLAAPIIERRHLDAAERRTNEIIFEDRPVRVLFGTAQELAAAGVRKQVDREGVLRAIEVEGFDRQPCGGTHVSRTGQVGLILLRRLEKVKGNWRVEFICGARSGLAAHNDYVALGEAARLLSCAAAEVPAMVARALEERQEGHRTRQRLTEELAGVQAQLLLATEGRDGRASQPGVVSHVASKVVSYIVGNSDPVFLRLLATKMVAQPNVRILLATRAGQIIFAQSPGLEGDMSALLRDCLGAGGGKGGGTRDFAQGSVPDPSRVEAVLDSALRQLERPT
ncbi:MAG TPA: alanyl-tRNA editing protein [Candidatus Limnocylindrales bacterium]|nr:alanyl-tRNA editing protein [Candidatus Limnocylindrales bacterium]